MRATLTPQPQILAIWRVMLTCAAALPAFLCSLLLGPGGTLWWVATAVWVAAFLFFYLFYLPMRLKRLRLEVKDDRFELASGVFRTISRTVPFGAVQYISLRSSPLHKHWGLTTLVVVAPGGIMQMPGLRTADAARLASVFFDEQRPIP